MNTSNRKIYQVVYGLAFAGILGFAIRGCEHKSPQNHFPVDRPTQEQLKRQRELKDQAWMAHIQRLREYADTANQLSYWQKMALLEAQDRQQRIIDAYQLIEGASYNGSYYGTSEAFQNEADYFMDHLDEFLDDWEDEIRFNPIIFDANRD